MPQEDREILETSLYIYNIIAGNSISNDMLHTTTASPESIRTCCVCGDEYTHNYYNRSSFYCCPSCADTHTLCSECGTIIELDSASYYNDVPFCSFCYNKITIIHRYSYKPDPIFLDDPSSSPRGYGWELEIDSSRSNDRRSTAHAILLPFKDNPSYSNSTPIYFKDDASLSEYGIEIVSHVGSLDYWLTSGIIEKICEIASEHHYKSHDTSTCGFHIHASKELFSPNPEFTLTKLILILERFWNTTLKLSRRSRSNMHRWCESYDLEDYTYSEICNKAHHHRIISISPYTYELRMFRGSLVPTTLYASLEFYDRLIKLAKRTTLEDLLVMPHSDFQEFIIKDTKYLESYLKSRLNAPIVDYEYDDQDEDDEDDYYE